MDSYSIELVKNQANSESSAQREIVRDNKNRPQKPPSDFPSTSPYLLCLVLVATECGRTADSGQSTYLTSDCVVHHFKFLLIWNDE